MSRKAILPQSRHHILVFDEDWEFLERHFGNQSVSRIGTSSAIRTIIHAKCNGLRALQNNALDRFAQKVKEEEGKEDE